MNHPIQASFTNCRMVVPFSGVVKVTLINPRLTHLAVEVFKVVNFLLFVRNFLGLIPPQQIFVYQLFNFGLALGTRVFNIFDPFAYAFKTVGVFASIQLRFLLNWDVFQANATSLLFLHRSQLSDRFAVIFDHFSQLSSTLFSSRPSSSMLKVTFILISSHARTF